MAEWHAGLDRSGTPAPKDFKAGHEFYVVVIAAVDLEGDRMPAFESAISNLRTSLHWSSDREFHANEAIEEVTLKLLDIGTEFCLRVGCLILDKREVYDLSIKPVEIMQGVTQEVTSKFFRKYCVSVLRCDQDIQGHLQKVERTMLKRIYRSICPDEKLRLGHPDSRQSSLVQMADAVAYLVRRFYSGKLKSRAARRFVEEIKANPGNVWIDPTGWPMEEEEVT